MLDDPKPVGEKYCQVENNLENGGFFGPTPAPNMKNRLVFDYYGNNDEQKTFEGFAESQKLLDRNQYFETLKSNKFYAKVPLVLKKDFDFGFVIAKKANFCTDC